MGVVKTERKWLAHLLDAAFDQTYENTNYVRLGDDLEEFNVEMNPTITITRNILGENSVTHEGYEVSSDVETYYHKYSDELSQAILELAMSRSQSGWTSYVEVLLKPNAEDPINGTPTVEAAWREDVLIAPTSYGGDSTGVQAPFTINYAGNRVKGTFDLETKKFTANTAI